MFLPCKYSQKFSILQMRVVRRSILIEALSQFLLLLIFFIYRSIYTCGHGLYRRILLQFRLLLLLIFRIVTVKFFQLVVMLSCKDVFSGKDTTSQLNLVWTRVHTNINSRRHDTSSKVFSCQNWNKSQLRLNNLVEKPRIHVPVLPQLRESQNNQ